MLTSPPIGMFIRAGAGGIVDAGSGWSSSTSWIMAFIAVAVLSVFAWQA